MKRLVLVIALLLLLAGCSEEKPVVEPTEEVTQTVMQLTYSVNSPVEQSSNGSVRMYEVSEGINNLEMLDDGLLLMDQYGKSMLINEDSCTIEATDSNEKKLLFAQGETVVGYVPDTNMVIVWDSNFNKTAEFVLEDGVTGELTASEKAIYYCVGDYIRALNMETGLARNVMQYVPEGQVFAGTFFDGDLIGWRNGEVISLISSEDGQVIFQDENLKDFASSKESYFGIYRDGHVEQYIWGTLDSTPVQLMLKGAQVYPQMNCSDIVVAQETDVWLLLERYDMDSVVRSGTVQLSFPGRIVDVVSSEKYTWILTDEGLYRWEYAINKPDTQESFIKPMVTEDNPNVKALAECAERAKRISDRYGIDVHIWQDALLNDDTYVVTAEYQTDTINKMLDDVETQLGRIPEQILHDTDAYCGLQICLVRSIQGHQFVQYLMDSGFCIAITPEANMEEAILTGLGRGIDSCVIGNSRDLDYWDDLNPVGFSYDYDYYINEHRTDLKYLEGENRAFVDKRAMSFPTEDRARIFYYAMTEGNEELFKSPVLQQKLKTFCEGIREAYGWQKEAQAFPWEQYLEQTLAYNK